MKNRDQLNEIYWKQEYENLRQEVLQTGPRGHGLALFLSRGMMAWLEALRVLVLASPRVSQNGHQESIDLPSAVRPDLTTLLASMVLSCMKREAHEHIQ